jgi:hypothetical protein
MSQETVLVGTRSMSVAGTFRHRREKLMADRGLWIGGGILIAGILTMIFGEVSIGLVLTTVGLIAFAVFTRLPRGDHRVSR